MFSKFTNILAVDDGVVALYHSLNLKVVFISENLLNRLFTLSEYNTKLRATGMIVESHKDDDELLKKIVDSLMSRPSIPSVMYLLLTDACNLACEYCFVENQIPGNQKRIHMDVKTAKKAVDFFISSFARYPEHLGEKKTIIFYGGEPLMNKNVFIETVKYVTKLKRDGVLSSSLSMNLLSNGLYFTPELVNFMRENEVNVSISIDGDQVATNLHRRDHEGKPVFGRIMKTVRLLQDENISFGVSCTINEETLKDTKKTIDFLVNNLKVKGLGFNILARGHSINIKRDYESRAASFILEAYEVFRQEGIYEDRIMRKVNSFTKQRIHPYDCAAAGGRQIVITPDGQVGICHGYIGPRKYFVGTVFDKDLIVEETSTYKTWKRRTPLTMPQCQACIALGICGGGCPCDAEISKGSLWELDERFCIHAKMTIEWLIKDLWSCVKDKKDEPFTV